MSSAELEADYSTCLDEWGFKYDPFRERYPIEPEEFWAGPRKNLEHLQFRLKSSMSQDEILSVLLIGDYGTGKTYLLNSLRSFVLKKLGGLGIYVQVPWKAQPKGFRDFYESVVREIGSDVIKNAGLKFAEREGINNPDSLRNSLVKKGVPGDLAAAISNLTYGVEPGLTWIWATANSTIYQQRALGLETNPRDESISVGILTGLLDFLSESSPIIVLFVDELEGLVGESAAIRSIRTGFRNLYDAIIYGKHANRFAFFGAATVETAYDLQYALGPAVLDRFDETLKLSPLSEEEAQEFVMDLVKDARKDGEGGASLAPFAGKPSFQEFLGRAPNASVLAGTARAGAPNTPRRLVKAGKYLLNLACEKKQYPITKEFVSTYLT